MVKHSRLILSRALPYVQSVAQKFLPGKGNALPLCMFYFTLCEPVLCPCRTKQQVHLIACTPPLYFNFFFFPDCSKKKKQPRLSSIWTAFMQGLPLQPTSPPQLTNLVQHLDAYVSSSALWEEGESIPFFFPPLIPKNTRYFSAFHGTQIHFVLVTHITNSALAQVHTAAGQKSYKFRRTRTISNRQYSLIFFLGGGWGVI